MNDGLQALGLVECTSIAAGIEAADAMLKAARVAPFLVKTICPGRFLAGVHGDVAAVQAAVGAGIAAGAETVADHFLIPRVSPEVISALACAVEPVAGPSVGIIETYSAASCILAADRAVKAARVCLAEVRLAMGLGGKAVCILCGDVSPVQAAVAAGAETAGESGLLVRRVVIPGMSPELFAYIL